jgi:hypothetical protein
MSTNFVHVVPRDPFFVPTPEVEDQARRWFGQAMLGGWEVTSTVMAPMGFVDVVEAVGDIHCPAYGAQLDRQWYGACSPTRHPRSSRRAAAGLCTWPSCAATLGSASPGSAFASPTRTPGPGRPPRCSLASKPFSVSRW